jgi:glucan-binding YG repeat protein
MDTAQPQQRPQPCEPPEPALISRRAFTGLAATAAGTVAFAGLGPAAWAAEPTQLATASTGSAAPATASAGSAGIEGAPTAGGDAGLIHSLAAGWQKDDNGNWQYLSNGAPATGRVYLPCWDDSSVSATYYFDANGTMRTDYWDTDGTSWYYQRANGRTATGWLWARYSNTDATGHWFYCDLQTGAMATGWQWLDWSGGTNWFYFGGANEGPMQTGWIYWNDGWYYCDDTSGAMLTGWQELNWNGDDSWYYFDASGKCGPHPYVKSDLAQTIVPAATNTYMVGREGHSVDKIVLHHACATTLSSVDGTFKGGSRSAAAHYAVSSDGNVHSYVSEADTAYHAANWDANLTSIGIENLNSTGSPLWLVSRDTMNVLIPLVADIAQRNGLGKLVKEQNIYQHKDFYNTDCAGHVWDYIDVIVYQANMINGYQAVVPNSWVYYEDHWYWTDANGVPTTGWRWYNGSWFYMQETSIMATGWQWLDWSGGTDWFYFSTADGSQMGAMLTGLQQIDGDTYYLDPTSGAMAQGLTVVNGTTYYFDPNNSGKMKTGWVQVGSSWYYFDTSSGAMLTGWQNLPWSGGTDRFYFNTDGTMVTGTVTIDGQTCNFDSNGCFTGYGDANGKGDNTGSGSGSDTSGSSSGTSGSDSGSQTS